MEKLIEGFVSQLKEAITIGEKISVSKPTSEIQNVLISGLGGSGIGSTIISQIVANEATVPLITNKDYFIPSFTNKHTLAIFSSYSGNTEETLHSLESAIKKGAKIVCVTSGGKLLEIAKENGFDYVQIPAGYPPRSAFGFSSVQLLYLLYEFGIISGTFKNQLKDTINLLISEKDSIKSEAKEVAKKLIGKIPVIYSDASYEGVCVRLRQQINENGKMLCWHHAIPEMNHNELVGWREKNDKLSVVIIRNSSDYDRTQQRMELNKKIISEYTSNITEIWSKGNSMIERSYYHIHLGDWISSYLADLKQIDPTEVKVIDFLKGELAKNA